MRFSSLGVGRAEARPPFSSSPPAASLARDPPSPSSPRGLRRRVAPRKEKPVSQCPPSPAVFGARRRRGRHPFRERSENSRGWGVVKNCGFLQGEKSALASACPRSSAEDARKVSPTISSTLLSLRALHDAHSLLSCLSLRLRCSRPPLSRPGDSPGTPVARPSSDAPTGGGRFSLLAPRAAGSLASLLGPFLVDQES